MRSLCRAAWQKKWKPAAEKHHVRAEKLAQDTTFVATEAVQLEKLLSESELECLQVRAELDTWHEQVQALKEELVEQQQQR